MPAIAATSSRVNASARWLSINQSAFWAGFMDGSPHSKRPYYEGFAQASFDSPCCDGFRERQWRHLFRAILGGRRLGFLLLILNRLLLRRLQFLRDLLQTDDGAFQAFDLAVRDV